MALCLRSGCRVHLPARGSADPAANEPSAPVPNESAGRLHHNVPSLPAQQRPKQAPLTPQPANRELLDEA
eukprot:3921115-Pleurochrysis_carterae.AAC.1